MELSVNLLLALVSSGVKGAVETEQVCHSGGGVEGPQMLPIWMVRG